MKPLTMSESEIRMRYRDGASAQILADLNACGWDRIKQIVGEPIEHKENKPRGHIDEKRARDLHAEGKTDKEMSIELGVSRGAVALWRSRRGFEANKKEENVMEINLNKLIKANIPESIETVSDAGQMIEEVEKCFEEVGETKTREQLFCEHWDRGVEAMNKSSVLESREQWEARRKDAIRTALIDALSKNGTLPGAWVIEWNERCEG